MPTTIYIAKRMGWDGATLSPRLFSGAVHYYTSDKVLDLGDGVELLPEGIVRYVFLYMCVCGLLRRCSVRQEVSCSLRCPPLQSDVSTSAASMY